MQKLTDPTPSCCCSENDTIFHKLLLLSMDKHWSRLLYLRLLVCALIFYCF
ncbi:UNVERIFIED_CONTAM: hypothetical protein FKN15_026820 [Acipenser sinensis]